MITILEFDSTDVGHFAIFIFVVLKLQKAIETLTDKFEVQQSTIKDLSETVNVSCWVE